MTIGRPIFSLRNPYAANRKPLTLRVKQFHWNLYHITAKYNFMGGYFILSMAVNWIKGESKNERIK